MLLQHLPAHAEFLTVLRHKQHASPVSLARVPPGMHRGALHRDVPAVHELFLVRVEQHLHAALEHHAIVQALRAVHHALVSRAEVHDAAHSPAGVDHAEFLGVDQVVMLLDVNVRVERRGKF